MLIKFGCVSLMICKGHVHAFYDVSVSEIDRNTRAQPLLGSRRVSGIGRLALIGSGGSRVFAILALQLA